MDKSEASELLHDHLRSWRNRSYQELVNQVGESHQTAVKVASGADAAFILAPDGSFVGE